jgi:hypothetical protein
VDDRSLINQFQTIESRLDALIQICNEKDNLNKELSLRIEKLEEELRTKIRGGEGTDSLKSGSTAGAP